MYTHAAQAIVAIFFAIGLFTAIGWTINQGLRALDKLINREDEP